MVVNFHVRVVCAVDSLDHVRSWWLGRFDPGASNLSTRKLILASLLLGVAILVAFAVQVVLAG